MRSGTLLEKTIRTGGQTLETLLENNNSASRCCLSSDPGGFDKNRLVFKIGLNLAIEWVAPLPRRSRVLCLYFSLGPKIRESLGGVAELAYAEDLKPSGTQSP